MSAFSNADGQTAGVTVLEFWPECGPGPVWTDDGRPFDLGQLGLGPDLVAEVAEWNGAYGEDKVPIDSPGDVARLQKADACSARFGPQWKPSTASWSQSRGGARSRPDEPMADHRETDGCQAE
jgi:hypothetical protein